MNVNPSSPQGPRQPTDPAALDGARPQEGKRSGSGVPPKAAESAVGRPDSVDLSAEARHLADGSDVRPGQSSLSLDRLQQVGERLAAGFYDQPEVIEQVARRVARDPDFRVRE
jgi:hypothetical protein